MNKKVLLLLLNIVQLQGMQDEKSSQLEQVINAKIQKNVKLLEPYSTIIAFDVDEVLISGREERFINWLKDHMQFGEYLAEAKTTGLCDAFAIIDKVISDHSDQKILADEFKKVIINAPLIEGMPELIHQLNKKGYTIIAASNMTTSTYGSMIEQKILPKEFNKNFFFVQTDPLNKKSDGSYYKKPEKEYYQNLLTYIESKFSGRYKTFIFTDDNFTHSEAATATGKIKGIHFKNPDQFKQELLMLGIPVN